MAENSLPTLPQSSRSARIEWRIWMAGLAEHQTFCIQMGVTDQGQALRVVNASIRFQFKGQGLGDTLLRRNYIFERN